MLQYDNSAFYFFCLSTISFYLIPSWYSILNRVYNAFGGLTDKDVGAVTRTSAEKKKAETLKKEQKGLAMLSSTGFLVNLLVTVIFTILFVFLVVSVANEGELNSFDPFSILEVDSNADMKTVKKAYRDKSLKYHPDKNPNNPAAEAKFMMVAKAYEALTDETARENWEKYGNPDGKQSLEVSIGLPSWLLDAENRNVVLVIYLIVMVGLIPYAVYSYYSKSSKYGEKDVMYDTYSWYHHTLGENTLIKSLPEFFAGSAEFRQRNIPKSQAEKEQIGQIMSLVRASMQKPKYNHPVLVKGNVLLHAHLLRQTDGLSNETMAALKYMLKNSAALVDAMISVCQYQDNMATASNCIEFGQYITQACWVRDSQLLQLPHFTAEEVKHVEKAKNKSNSITAYRSLPDDQKKGMATFTDEQKGDVLKCLNEVIPNVTVETKVFVDDDEDDKVYEGDLCTVRVIITRNNLNEGEKAGLVHAPRFPYPKLEAWWVMLGTREGKIVSIEKVTSPNKVVEHNIKFLAPRQGTYEFDLMVKSNAYIGLDVKMPVTMEIHDNSALPEYKIHPDDAQLDDEPTLFEEMLNANIEQDDSDSDSDDDDDDDDDDEPASKKKSQITNARKAAAKDDDDDDDDDEVEEVYEQK
mmetsp:Transcript_16192/g.23505  ORF Transcript_16192/g.23505 Transcript_16192/m.23505 type:complete len:637 (-) Transcript_16192:78-1988(-)|eukprot:CAMPEP_0202448330 /NCGR_PEP_ID=MMETSP1360-20130828/7152_1 /ASSEMBLY_ACC=CAM_ASM_000848 /TAXON_ID=515479 /ORGANISM="Licmophora paradoxa, Strain CCMP2313" /LENGTH=636 /DNA_ID=CAMNT_0049065851 /DNA_START=42 /DNA_END=1952 /DNA_ORIENTATION=+